MKCCVSFVLCAALIFVTSGCSRPAPEITETEEVTKPPKKPDKVYLTNSIGMKLVLVPAGKFLMGSPKSDDPAKDIEKQHEVEITRPFYLGVHEVTQRQYEQVMGSNPSSHAPSGKRSVYVEGLDTSPHPVETVSWEQATEFCRKLAELPAEKQAGRAYRLPTEAEWEYACRANANPPQPYHCGLFISPDLANINGRLRRTREVGSYVPNEFGLYDMHGNVAEWVADWFGPYPTEPGKDPQGPATGRFRAARGGAWTSPPDRCWSAYRFAFVPTITLNDFGFRVALSAGR